MTYKRLTALEQLLGSYFHQDWADEFGSSASALQSIVASEPKEKLAAGIEEIDDLLAGLQPEGDVETILTDQVGCYFNPSSEGMTYEQWLMRVRKEFAVALQDR